MKKHLLIAFIVFAQFTNAQIVRKLWGTATDGGALGNGTIIEGDSTGNGFHVVYSMDQIHGRTPEGNLVQAGNGKLYGITVNGGPADSCCLFTYDPRTHTYTDVYDFDTDWDNGDYPMWGMTLATNGKLYGLTSAGGVSGYSGVMYYVDPTDDSYHKIHDFDNTNGSTPYGGLIQASNGKLYGMTYDGGANGAGVLFSFDISTNSYIVLYNFTLATGTNPYYGSLIEANGKLFGMTSEGGAHDGGVIFSYAIASNTYSDLYDFDPASTGSGSNPYGSLMKGIDGKLYGMTMGGGTLYYGIIFSFNITTNGFSKLHDFDNTHGGFPKGSLSQAHDGKLYGTTELGGANGVGTVFKFDLDNNEYTDVFDFNGTTTGSNPICDIFESTQIATGISSIDNSGGDFALWNHSNGRFTVISNISSSSQLNIYDVVGKIIFSENLAFGKNEIDLRSKPPGIYFFSVSSENQTFNQKIFLK
jgi:uncharacterized repeat protein (TIGR03803 family)